MKLYQLRSTLNNEILYEGQFSSFTECLESAVSNKTKLHFANLRNKNLTNANLDDGLFAHADFSNSNLSGANISDAYLKNAIFAGSALYNTCFCHSNLSDCNFDHAHFGGTDLYDALLDRALFTGLSSFNLDFASARQMRECIFVSNTGKIAVMSRPPIVIHGLSRRPLVISDNAALLGHNVLNADRLKSLAAKITNRTLRQRLT